METLNTKHLGQCDTTLYRAYEFEHCTVQLRVSHPVGRSSKAGYAMVEVQMVDGYGWQRELAIGPILTSTKEQPDKWTLGYRCHAYLHPGIRHIQYVSLAAGRKFMDGFIRILSCYPGLLFSKPGECPDNGCANRGFHNLHQRLLHGYQLSLELL
jgi:hypothetical protein